MILLEIDFSFPSLFFFLLYCSEFIILVPMYYSDMYLKKERKKDKNGLIISWQIPTSSLENGTIFLPSFFQYECTEKDFRTAQDPVLQSFKLEFCIILIQLGEKTAKKTTTHTHKYTSHKKTKETWNALSGLKKYVRVLYIAYMNMFLKISRYWDILD